VYLEVKNENLYMGMLSVEPTLQGNGIGKLLVSSAIQYGQSLGLEKIQIQVVHLRQELILWYEKLGFITSDKIMPFEVPLAFGKPKVPLHFIEMNRSL
jgi:ribosomal protein S18 acetylase RimI-like enzyme